jgi:hypothetical protein
MIRLNRRRSGEKKLKNLQLARMTILLRLFQG